MRCSVFIVGPRAGRKAGFTLIELLVVLGIVALLMGVLLPVLGKARSGAKAVKCLSHQRTLGQAMGMYHLDHRHTFPQPAQETEALGAVVAGASLWFNAIDVYLQQTRKNYSADRVNERNYETFKQDPVWTELPEDAPGNAADRRNTQTIKMNAFFGNNNLSVSVGRPAVAWIRVTQVPLPGKTAVFVDGRAHDTPSQTTGNIDTSAFHANPTFVAARHGGGANLARADGSAVWETNDTTLSSSGYRGWHKESADSDRGLWPETVFDFRR